MKFKPVTDGRPAVVKGRPVKSNTGQSNKK